jgi:hypothetical protein
MGTGRATFRESDLARAFKAAKKAGVKVRVDIKPGNELAVTMLDEQEVAEATRENTWDTAE